MRWRDRNKWALATWQERSAFGSGNVADFDVALFPRSCGDMLHHAATVTCRCSVWWRRPLILTACSMPALRKNSGRA